MNLRFSYNFLKLLTFFIYQPLQNFFLGPPKEFKIFLQFFKTSYIF